MSFFKNSKNFLENKACPVCNGKEFFLFTSNYKNVYSELISKYIGLDENNLLRENKVLKCKICNTSIWKYKLSKDIRNILYENLLPIHPKGEDSTGKSFNLISMTKRLKNLDKLSKQRRRILDGYISSMIFNNDIEEIKVKEILYENKFTQKYNVNILKKIFNRGPKYLSRYAGFRNTVLNDLIIKNIKNGYFDLNYIEYGCTSWGPIDFLLKKGFKCISIIPKRYIFWDCRSHSNDHNLNNYQLIEEIDINGKIKLFENSILSLVLVLDHIDNPYEFLKNFINLGVKCIFLVLESSLDDGYLPIQHLTSFDKRSLIYLSERLGCEIEFIDLKSNLYISALIKIKPNN